MAQDRQRFTVQWVDTDASGRIHNTAAIRWAEAAEHTLLAAAIGIERVASFPRARIEVNYHGALRFGDEIEVVLTAERIGRTSFTYSWQIEHQEQVRIAGRTVVVHVDDTGRPSALPEALRDALADLARYEPDRARSSG